MKYSSRQIKCRGPQTWSVGMELVSERERDRASIQRDRVLFSSVGLWEGFFGVKITQILTMEVVSELVM